MGRAVWVAGLGCVSMCHSCWVELMGGALLGVADRGLPALACLQKLDALMLLNSSLKSSGWH